MNDVNGHIIAGHHPEEISEKLLWIIFKIHEKIESLENDTKGTVFENNWLLKELKSLLENEK